MQVGIVKKWENSSGWGFIEGDDGDDYFFNIAKIQRIIWSINKINNFFFYH